jgi:hypothetical protein
MKLTCTKGAGKFDTLAFDTGAPPLACPKQGILPHDLLHLVVEAALGVGAFLTRAAAGKMTATTVSDDAALQAVERIVETLQADLWSGPASDADLLAIYLHACESRSHPPLPLSVAQLRAMRVRVAELGAAWDAVTVGGRLELALQERPAGRA